MDASNLAASQPSAEPFLESSDAAASSPVQINRRAQQRILGGHPWVYRSDVLALPAGQPKTVAVAGPDGQLLGRALLSPRSQIVLRMVSRGREGFDVAELQGRLRAAILRRRLLLGEVSACRLVHGEADFLPGLFVDRYADALVVQSTCAGSDAWVAACVEALRAQLRPRLVVLRNDIGARAHEGLDRGVHLLHGAK
ncbi:MAG: hypothetical protein EOO40_03730, partial [Deltaproteobacteria bacterium]